MVVKKNIAVIIVNYNTPKLVKDCITSLQNHSDTEQFNLEFVIVDNASSDEHIKSLESYLNGFENTQLVLSRINLGFAAGNNLGVQNISSNADYYAFINSDVLFVEPCFHDMWSFMKNNPSCGLCGIQILDKNKSKTISHRPFEGVRYKLFGKKFLYATQPKKPRIQQVFQNPVAVDFIIGSFMFFDANAFCKIGGFDPNTFLYYEETDICYRLKKAGYSTYFLPNLSYIHLEGQSAGFNLLKKKEHLLSYLYVTRKNFGFVKFFIIKNYLLLSYFFKAIFKKKHRPIFWFLLTRGESLSHSLRHQQQIKPFME